MIEQLSERLQLYGITQEQADGIMSRGVTGRDKTRIWVEPAIDDRALVGGFSRVEMTQTDENGNPVRYD